MKKFLSFVFLIIMIIVSSCVNQRPAYIPEADEGYFLHNSSIDIDINSIVETMDGSSDTNLPEWLLAFFYGGNEAVEMIGTYYDKYVFVAMQQGDGFAALNIWAQRFSAQQDFSMLAGTRIEKRMITSADIYPDYEYGLFFEKLVKNAYSGEYPGISKEEIYWIKIKKEENDLNDSGDSNDAALSETYMFFILLTINKYSMQTIIEDMITQTLASVTPAKSQAAAINRLRQNFFTGF